MYLIVSCTRPRMSGAPRSEDAWGIGAAGSVSPHNPDGASASPHLCPDTSLVLSARRAPVGIHSFVVARVLAETSSKETSSKTQVSCRQVIVARTWDVKQRQRMGFPTAWCFGPEACTFFNRQAPGVRRGVRKVHASGPQQHFDWESPEFPACRLFVFERRVVFSPRCVLVRQAPGGRRAAKQANVPAHKLHVVDEAGKPFVRPPRELL